MKVNPFWREPYWTHWFFNPSWWGAFIVYGLITFGGGCLCLLGVLGWVLLLLSLGV